MMTLFVSNTRSSGRFDPARDRAYTESQGLLEPDWEGHLKGVKGVGGVPILDDDTAWWGAIDCDNHGSDEDLPLAAVDEKIRMLKLPLVPCRSKSGGIHVYAFFEAPQPAARVRALLAAWSGQIGYGGHEIFPKQGKLTNDKAGKRNLGNWLNLPYFDEKKTMRYAMVEGKPLSLPQFIDYAVRMRITEQHLRALALSDHPDAPPCIQHIFTHGVAQGHRNEGLYNVVVYLRKVDTAGGTNAAEAKAIDANQTIFDRPLPRAELGRTIGSALRADMQYRCNEEPIRSLCKREDCLKRKFGITPADADRLATSDSLPAFGNLVKYLAEPVRWDLEIDGVRINNVATDDLLDWRAIRKLVAERLTKVVPMIKNQEWERILSPMMKEARIVETPDDASISGTIRARLREYASKTDLASRGENTDDRRALLRGLPVVQRITVSGMSDRYVLFRGEDFVNYLKRTKSEELKGINLWMAVKEICDHTKLRAGDQNINVWVVPVKEVVEHLGPPSKAEFKSEL